MTNAVPSCERSVVDDAATFLRLWYGDSPTPDPIEHSEQPFAKRSCERYWSIEYRGFTFRYYPERTVSLFECGVDGWQSRDRRYDEAIFLPRACPHHGLVPIQDWVIIVRRRDIADYIQPDAERAYLRSRQGFRGIPTLLSLVDAIADVRCEDCVETVGWSVSALSEVFRDQLKAIPGDKDKRSAIKAGLLGIIENTKCEIPPDPLLVGEQCNRVFCLECGGTWCGTQHARGAKHAPKAYRCPCGALPVVFKVDKNDYYFKDGPFSVMCDNVDCNSLRRITGRTITAVVAKWNA